MVLLLLKSNNRQGRRGSKEHETDFATINTNVLMTGDRGAVLSKDEFLVSPPAMPHYIFENLWSKSMLTIAINRVLMKHVAMKKEGQSTQ